MGKVTRLEVDRSYLERYDVQRAAGYTILEYWVPSEDLGEITRHMVGTIEVVADFR